MRIWVLCVGRPGVLLAAAIEEYERRANRYWTVEVVEVKEERAAEGRADDRVRALEAQRLLGRVPPGADVIALTREGSTWSSRRLASYLEERAAHSRSVAFLIGGARGLGEVALARADRQLALSPFTLPHELARLVLAEQLYRAGTILRGEPYHKAAD